jgi:hypothetical protein
MPRSYPHDWSVGGTVDDVKLDEIEADITGVWNLAEANSARLPSYADFAATYGGSTGGTASGNATALDNAAGTSNTVYIRSGTYLMGALTLGAAQGDVRIIGNGPGTVLSWSGTSGSMITVSGNQRVTFENLTMYHGGSNSALLTVNGSFGGRLLNVRMYGQHTAKGATAYHGTVGWDITGNSGDWEAYGCHWANLGQAVRSDSVENWIYGGRWTHNYIGVKSNGSGCGLVLTGPKFVTATDTAALYDIDLSSGGQQFIVSGGWFEGADECILMGTSGGNGVAQMSVRDSYMAASVRCLNLRNGRPVLSHVRCSPNPAKTLTATLSTTGDTPYGIADFVVSANGAPAVTYGTAGDNKYPSGWHVRGHGTAQTGGA